MPRARALLCAPGRRGKLLLLALLHRPERAWKARSRPVCPTGTDIAQVIRSGHADCGIATRSVANAAGLGFVPILWRTSTS
ncbi:MAG: substrate-binding domain-containing protein [Xanthobacteraceae bacterium]